MAKVVRLCAAFLRAAKEWLEVDFELRFRGHAAGEAPGSDGLWIRLGSAFINVKLRLPLSEWPLRRV